MPFIPHTEADVARMLEALGAPSIDALFDEVPASLRCKRLEDLAPGRSEMAVTRLLESRARADEMDLCFLGAGAYEHHIPAAVWDIAARGEYMTAYTPYQAEASQGTLQLIYEFQSMMTALTGMEVSNASLYDGASALAEAVLMAIRANRRGGSRRVLLAGTLNPVYRRVTDSIVRNQGIELLDTGFDPQSLQVLPAQLQAFEDEDLGALVVAQPNFFGGLEDVHRLTDWAHARGIPIIAVVNPTSLAVLEAPGHWGEKGADIVLGEGQPLGIPLASGGPYFGFLCCRQALMRQMPGRIIGRTEDMEGRIGYTLTLQAREQHIRRSKATSNICTNQGLAVTAATIYLSLLGAEGLKRVAASCHRNSLALRERLLKIPGVEPVGRAPFFHEFVVKVPNATARLEQLAARGILGGLALQAVFPELDDCILVCATETRTDEDLEHYADTLETLLTSPAEDAPC